MSVSFLLFAVVAAITPGPSNVMLAAAGANVGVMRGLPCLLGVTIGMGLPMILVGPLGLGSLVLHSPIMLKVLNRCGAVFLVLLAWKIATASTTAAAATAEPGCAPARQEHTPNPSAGSALAQSALIGVLFFLPAMPSRFLWLALGATAQRFLRGGHRLRIFNIIMGVLLLLSVVFILL